jgi:hypothetical protein
MHFEKVENNTHQHKPKNKVKKSPIAKMDISSLPVSEYESQGSTILRFDKFEDDKLPNALSSLNDQSSSEIRNSGEYDYSEIPKTPENVKKIIDKFEGNSTQKLNLITKEIYKVAKGMADDTQIVNKTQAEYISK